MALKPPERLCFIIFLVNPAAFNQLTQWFTALIDFAGDPCSCFRVNSVW
jgi:hypothetical protein